MQNLQDIGNRLGLKYFAGYDSISDDHRGVTVHMRNLILGEITNKEDLMGPCYATPQGYFTILDIDGQFGPPVSRSIWRTQLKFYVEASKRELLVSTKTLHSMVSLML